MAKSSWKFLIEDFGFKTAEMVSFFLPSLNKKLARIFLPITAFIPGLALCPEKLVSEHAMASIMANAEVAAKILTKTISTSIVWFGAVHTKSNSADSTQKLTTSVYIKKVRELAALNAARNRLAYVGTWSLIRNGRIWGSIYWI
jgi:hypothetical protein